eukprot:6172974-Pleurochrysis_carterae.AAC.5
MRARGSLSGLRDLTGRIAATSGLTSEMLSEGTTTFLSGGAALFGSTAQSRNMLHGFKKEFAQKSADAVAGGFIPSRWRDAAASGAEKAGKTAVAGTAMAANPDDGGGLAAASCGLGQISNCSALYASSGQKADGAASANANASSTTSRDA